MAITPNTALASLQTGCTVAFKTTKASSTSVNTAVTIHTCPVTAQ